MIDWGPSYISKIACNYATDTDHTMFTDQII